ncbi:hypothetical protein HLASF_1080 [Halanaeroarchaeum sulfurireducens]|uniref:Uncharacterized protein n=1 Tax=Halanaeroarchaeum sulfurireducens TaxID=1604004 RepID=A0A0F7PE03_9EURY|nr:hypothetical protein HLASF_1080 [Halanaeroarchaeum sulfurireducens]ALG81964.1 hypothetical protein HLASA_1069 [Halanaeroarchaeum sulfurireducens]
MATIRRWHPVRHGSEQRTIERTSLVGSRGGGGARDYSDWNGGQPRPSTFIYRFIHRYTATHPLIRHESVHPHFYRFTQYMLGYLRQNW